MSWAQPTADLANMLPGPRFQPDQPQQLPPSPPPAAASGDHLVAEQREARRERRRVKQASPGEGRNSRPHSVTGEPDGALTSPTRAHAAPAVSPLRQDSDIDVTRYGLVADPAESPKGRPQRRRMSAAGSASPEPRGGQQSTDQGSDQCSPTRRISRADMISSRDSLDSLTGAASAAGRSRRGSGFKKGLSGAAKSAKVAPPSSVADLHVVGEIVGATGFDAPMLFCRWQLLYEPQKSWKLVRGQQQGASHACCSALEEEDLRVWEHPLDMHLQTQSLQGWPSLLVMVFAREESSNRDVFVSYALVPLPNTPGMHHLTSQTWFAVESTRTLGRRFFGWFTGLTPRLEDESFITDTGKRDDAGPFICTVGAGQVHLRLHVLTRNLDHVSHRGGESLAAALERLNTKIRRSAAMEERRRSTESIPLTEGQRQVRGGRDERLIAARQAAESRRRGEGPPGLSPVASDLSRVPSSGERSGAPASFRGFSAGAGGGVHSSWSPRGGPTDTTSGQEDAPSAPRDRYAEAMARRAAREKAAAAAAAAAATAPAQEGSGASPPRDAGGGASGSGTTPPLSRPTSISGAPGGAAGQRSDSGAEGTGARSQRGGAAATGGSGNGGGGIGGYVRGRGEVEGDEDDDGLETIDGGVDGMGVVDVGNELGVRAAARAERRARQRAVR